MGWRSILEELLSDAGFQVRTCASFGDAFGYLRLETGMVHIGDQTINDEPQVPFGGVKGSGYGRFGGQAALDEFTELRWINIQRTPRTFP